MIGQCRGGVFVRHARARAAATPRSASRRSRVMVYFAVYARGLCRATLERSTGPSRLPAARADVDFAAPVPVVGSALSGPVKRIRLDFRKDPAHRTAPRIRARLDDVRALRPADLLSEEIRCRIAPKNSPGVDLGIVDPQRRPVPIACAGQRLDSWLAVLQAWNHPDVLNGPTLQHPPCVNLAATAMRRSIVEDRRNVQLPSAHDPRIEFELGRT